MKHGTCKEWSRLMNEALTRSMLHQTSAYHVLADGDADDMHNAKYLLTVQSNFQGSDQWS
jgi:hypothetical protein